MTVDRQYPPKAILGTAYEFASGQRLASSDFEGGKAGAVRVLGNLGFTVRPQDRLLAVESQRSPAPADRRYVEANRRFTSQVKRLVDAPQPADVGFYRNAGLQFTVAEVVHDVLAAEQEVQLTGQLAPIESEIDQRVRAD